MLTLPETIERPEQAYAYINYTVRMDQMQQPADEGFPILLQHVADQGLIPVGAPFYNYRRINMADTLDVEAGVPLERAGQSSDRVKFGTLPGGRFVTLDWIGHPDKLEQVTGMLIGWLRLTEQPLDMEERADGDHFACRLEIYEDGPHTEPDINKWKTTLQFKLKD